MANETTPGFRRSTLNLLARLAGVASKKATRADRKNGELAIEVYGQRYNQMVLLDSGPAVSIAHSESMRLGGQIEIRPEFYLDVLASLDEVKKTGDDYVLYYSV